MPPGSQAKVQCLSSYYNIANRSLSYVTVVCAQNNPATAVITWSNQGHCVASEYN
jgi:hypothetical protein